MWPGWRFLQQFFLNQELPLSTGLPVAQGPLNRPHLKGPALVTSPHCGPSFPGSFQGQEPFLGRHSRKESAPPCTGQAGWPPEGIGAVSRGKGVTAVKHCIVTDGSPRTGWGSDLGPRAGLGCPRQHLGKPPCEASLIGTGGRVGLPRELYEPLNHPSTQSLSTADVMVVFTHKNGKLFY